MPANTATSEKTDQETTLCDANVRALLHLQKTLQNMKDCTYTQSPCAGISPVGGHVRHIIEFYQEFFKAEKNGFETGLSYDKRARNLNLETSRQAAINQIENIMGQLTVLQPNDNPIALSMTICAENAKLHRMITTPNRELFHLLDHATHHMALIKMTAAQVGEECDENLGIANATLAHKNTKDATAASPRVGRKPCGD